MPRVQGLLDDKCLNCMQSKEKSAHLNWCPEAGRTLLFRESVAALVSWMNDFNCTDAELAYWIENYLLFCGTRSFTSLVTVGGGGFFKIMTAAASQDLIGWIEFLHGKIFVNIEATQQVHWVLSPCQIMGPDWMKSFLSHLMLVSHSRWIFWNFTLHNKQCRYL
jgi:hypothetical protein